MNIADNPCFEKCMDECSGKGANNFKKTAKDIVDSYGEIIGAIAFPFFFLFALEVAQLCVQSCVQRQCRESASKSGM